MVKIFFGGYRCLSTRIFGVDIYQARIRIFLVISNSLFFFLRFFWWKYDDLGCMFLVKGEFVVVVVVVVDHRKSELIES